MFTGDQLVPTSFNVTFGQKKKPTADELIAMSKSRGLVSATSLIDDLHAFRKRASNIPSFETTNPSIDMIKDIPYKPNGIKSRALAPPKSYEYDTPSDPEPVGVLSVLPNGTTVPQPSAVHMHGSSLPFTMHGGKTTISSKTGKQVSAVRSEAAKKAYATRVANQKLREMGLPAKR